MKNIMILPNATVKQAMEALDRTAENVLLVVNEANKLIGTLTDGDVRRHILAGKSLKGTIENAYHTDPIFVYKKDYEISSLKKKLVKTKVDLIPIVDDQKVVLDYITWEKAFSNGGKRSKNKVLIDAPLVIMAGGKGTRLEPFTRVLPKPLIPINGKVVITTIIDRFGEYGINDIYVTVNHMAKIIKAYFEEISPKYSVSFVSESEPLGTAGSLKLLSGQFTAPFFVSNCDILINADYNDVYKHHQENAYDITIVTSLKHYSLPYGTCELDEDGSLKRLTEKPEYSYLVNTGLYILNPEVLDLIPNHKFYHITDLMRDIKLNGGKIGVYPVSENAWIDIGEWDEYKKAVAKLEFNIQ
jgi:dTDP-glucose pyrophosphorylase